MSYDERKLETAKDMIKLTSSIKGLSESIINSIGNDFTQHQYACMVRTYMSELSKKVDLMTELCGTDEATRIKEIDSGGAYSIKLLPEGAFEIIMPLLPTVSRNGKQVTTGVVAHNVRLLARSYLEDRNLKMPYFKKATMEYILCFGKDRKGIRERDHDNTYTKDITDCLTDIMYEDDDCSIIESLTLRARTVKKESYTKLVIKPVTD